MILINANTDTNIDNLLKIVGIDTKAQHHSKNKFFNYKNPWRDLRNSHLRDSHLRNEEYYEYIQDNDPSPLLKNRIIAYAKKYKNFNSKNL